ncbi:tetratricopeptide repeat protein [Methanospirillum stamsii]|uniref:Tetratricopeptide repeat protein n=1 Tax=Methanospirillum stamsii TaxID=1277351 RepID=A0A2V2NH86_9EURY|nr:tetratricopeptide repeat protein [Methanospirillum stamsii]PWR75767.1 hypothetical protein DLD82_02725 [Methanospirillum stamsii]
MERKPFLILFICVIASLVSIVQAETAFELCDEGYNALNASENLNAINYFNQAIELDPTIPDVWAGKGYALMILGDLEKSLTAFDMAIKLNPNLPGLWDFKSNILRMLGRIEEADESNTKAKEIAAQLKTQVDNPSDTSVTISEATQETSPDNYQQSNSFSNIYPDRSVSTGPIGYGSGINSLANQPSNTYYNKYIDWSIIISSSNSESGPSNIFSNFQNQPLASNTFPSSNIKSEINAPVFPQENDIDPMTEKTYGELLEDQNKFIPNNPENCAVYLEKSRVLEALGRYEEAIDALKIAIGMDSFPDSFKGSVESKINNIQSKIDTNSTPSATSNLTPTVTPTPTPTPTPTMKPIEQTVSCETCCQWLYALNEEALDAHPECNHADQCC